MIAKGDTYLGYIALLAQPKVRQYLKFAILAILAIFSWLYLAQKPGAFSFLLIATGSLFPILVWLRAPLPGVPLTCFMGLQALLLYGTPLIVSNPDVFAFPVAEVIQASTEVTVFELSLGFGWLVVAYGANHRSALFCWRFRLIDEAKPHHTNHLPLLLLGAGVLFLAANMQGLSGVLPDGIFPIVRTLFDAASIAGGLMGGYYIARRILSGGNLVIYIFAFVIHCILTAANYTLFPATSLFIALIIGLFIGGGRLPLLAIGSFFAIFGFLNLSKFEMRKTYWEPGTAFAYQTLGDLPTRYCEWSARSWEILTSTQTPKYEHGQDTEQKLSDRINNLINILIAQDGLQHRSLKPLWGETYTIIPALLIPRFLWPEKPRTHEGMVLLNVYFSRQTYEESFTTYISWGLLPECYANFGPWFGAILCGLVLGSATAWLEFWSRPYPIASLEAMVFMLLFVQCGTSFESVASVWLTSIFQMLVAVIAGTVLFIRRSSIILL